MSTTKILAERYEVGELLGYGGMAEVRLARDTRLGRDVAVKILRSDLARDQTFQARFRREGQSAAALNHQAIVAVYDTGTDPSTTPPTPFIVMEYVEGQTLRDLLRSKGRLEPHEAMRIVAEMCAALDFSHRGGIVHRDVKPGNVMITPAGRVKVMDFGIARAVSDTQATMTATAAVIGTAQYLSPEQARGEPVDARSDVYAAGCVLYELLTGSPPFVGDSPVAVAYQHVRENPVPPSQVRPEISRELDAITMKALSKNPANRYQSAAAMQDDLERALRGEKIAATPVMTEQERTALISTTPPVPPELGDDDLHDGEPAKKPVRTRTWVLLGALLVAAIVAAFLIIPNLGKDEPVQVSVPSVAGLSEEEATARLESAGLKVGDVTETVSTIDQQGRIVGQNPSSGSAVDRGSTVDLEIGSGPAQRTIPGDIVGKTQEEVTAALTAEGLQVTAVQQDAPQAAGTVVNSSPAPGTAVPEGSTVTIFVSTGQVDLPDVTGMDEQTAIATLNEAGFTNITSTSAPSTQPAGIVIAQDPGQGQAAATTTITLTLSEGPITVPNVVGTDQASATTALASAGLTGAPNIVTQPNAAAAGTVLNQNPAAGEQVASDVTITLTISGGPPPTTSTPPPSSPPTSSPASPTG